MSLWESPIRGALSLTRRPWSAIAVGAVLLFSGAGCVVTQSTYDAKVREADALREALAPLSRENSRLAEENAALSREVATGKETEAGLSAQLKDRDESLKALSGEAAEERKKYEGRRVSREQFINELLEKEKAAGKRLQEQSARAEGYERDLDRMKKEAEAREQEVAELRKMLEAAMPSSEATRLERDVLAGRVERLQEERREAERRRGELLAELSAGLGKLSPEVSVFPMGPAFLVVAPEKLLVKDQGEKLTKLGNAVVSQVAGAVAGIPSASLVVITGGKASADALRRAASNGKVPEGRLHSHVRARERQAELLLIAP